MIEKIKLTQKQKEVILEMRADNGNIIHFIDGIDARCFMKNKTIRWATIFALKAKGLIEKTDKFFRLTELGKTIEL
jgi:predicted transcriptional regulator